MSRNRISKNELNDSLKNDIYAIASTDKLGKVKVDGDTITIDENGMIKGANKYIEKPWIIANLNSSWSNVVGELKYYKDDFGIVRISGVVKSDTPTQQIITTLPSDYRPSFDMYLIALITTNGTTRTLTISTNGEIKITDALASAPVSISVTFRTI